MAGAAKSGGMLQLIAERLSSIRLVQHDLSILMEEDGDCLDTEFIRKNFIIF
jgi:hypothetical protein